MKVRSKIRNIVVEVICLLYILLFVYAGISKILDFENFQVQLGQSPLLSAFAGVVSWAVPVIEVLIAVTLMTTKYRLMGLISAFCLMIMFTVYIFIILNFSSFIPCSCGGILEKLGWTEHLIFNIVFIILSFIGILLLNQLNDSNKDGSPYKIFKILPVSFFGSTVIIVILYLSSEHIIHHRNNFIRRFPHHPASEIRNIELKYNSYYFAGINSDVIYLGNYTTPFQITSTDKLLTRMHTHDIKLDKVDFTFRSVEIRVLDDLFYLFDGTVPCIYTGEIINWRAKLQEPIGVSYMLAEPVDTNLIVFRAFADNNGENVLGSFYLKDKRKIEYKPKLLEKQIDGIFDTDGMLRFDKTKRKVVYLYKYRNQYLSADVNLSNVTYGKTIDTFSKAKLEVKYISSSKERKLAAPPFVVNKTIAINNDRLYVASALQGRYESTSLWKTATIIDVYNVDNKSYLFSFPVYNNKDEKMKSFIVDGNKLFAIVGTQLVIYKLNNV